MNYTPRERIKLALDHKEADRVAIMDNPWPTTVTRWHSEGLPEDVSPHEYFQYEMNQARPDNTLRFPIQVLEETDEYTISINGQGATMKEWKHMTSTRHYLDFTVKDRKTWEEYKPNYNNLEGRIDTSPETMEFYRRERERGQFIMYVNGMGYDYTQGIVGSEQLLMAMMEDPDWVRDMFEATADINIRLAEEMMAAGYEFDGAFLFDDLGYRNTSLFSPQTYRELLFPVHKRVFGFFHSKGLKTILHSCGCVKGLIPQLIEAGLDCLQPLEVKAGMDVIELKKQYGDQLAFMGGIDARKLSRPAEELEEEIKTKVTVAKQGGGYIFHTDHSVPDDVSFEQYKKFIELGLKYGRYDS